MTVFLYCVENFNYCILIQCKMRSKVIFYTDIVLAVVFFLTFISGLMLHMAGHGWTDEDLWQCCHLVSSAFFVLCGIFHVACHKMWYKYLSKGVRKRDIINFLLSIAFVFTALSGLILIIENNDSFHLGMFHYLFGVLLSVFSIWHFIKRFSVLRNLFLKNRNSI